MLSKDQQKELAARAAAQLVEDGQIIGLGSGTTVAPLLDALAERVKNGLRFTSVSTSDGTTEHARRIGLSLSTLEQHPQLDLAIDGADEVDPRLNLIKGQGGALLREKIVASAARRFVVIVDQSKHVKVLGERMPVPVEVVPFGWTATLSRLRALGIDPVLRQNSQAYRTDNGNYILDCRIPPLADPAPLAASIKEVTGVVEHGLFLGMATGVIAGNEDGTVTMMGNLKG